MLIFDQAMRDTLKRHIDDTFGIHLREENDIGLVIDGKVAVAISTCLQVFPALVQPHCAMYGDIRRRLSHYADSESESSDVIILSTLKVS